MVTIDILLATYNGARFLPDQLASLAAQTHPNWRVILRDDGSSDGSPDLVRRWAEEGGHPLVVIENGRPNLGAKGNFAALLEASDAPYFACCDQDDVWLPEKLDLMLGRLQQAEARRGADTPLLAYSDLEVVDERLGQIAPSFRRYASLQQPRQGCEVVDLMTQNVVTGCAMLGNAALREAAVPVPSEAVMHDWWLALVAAAAGELIDVPETTIRYRQHGGNAIGAVRWTHFALARSLATDFAATKARVKVFHLDSRLQATLVSNRFHRHMSHEVTRLVESFAALEGASKLQKIVFCAKHGMQLRRPVRTAIATLIF